MDQDRGQDRGVPACSRIAVSCPPALGVAWKDSGDAVIYPDGSLVKALCELQGYVYNAWVRMAEAFDALGKPDRAKELRAKAAALFERFNEGFWDEELGFYVYALDGNKNKVLTVASNPGHCLWCGIVPRERAKKVVDRLMAPDMWTGWGIRTLSADPVLLYARFRFGSACLMTQTASGSNACSVLPL